jgi:hypothetical protein
MQMFHQRFACLPRSLHRMAQLLRTKGEGDWYQAVCAMSVALQQKQGTMLLSCALKLQRYGGR